MIKEKIKSELQQLINDIKTFSFILAYSCSLKNRYSDEDVEKYEEVIYDFENEIFKLDESYNIFYAKSCRVMSVVLPERLQEFRSCYVYDRKASQKGSFRAIADYFNHSSIELRTSFEKSIEEHTYNLFIQQKNILLSAYEIIDSVLFDIENIMQFNLFINELDIAQDLLNKKYVRAAGVIASTVFDGHLKTICKNNPNITLKYKDTIGKYIEYLRSAKVIDAIEQRKLQCLNDTRTLCCHKKDREPTETEVQDLITGTKRVLSDVH